VIRTVHDNFDRKRGTQMASITAVNDNHSPENDQELNMDLCEATISGVDHPIVQSIVSTAVLLRTAFRLRDEDAMVSLLRNLANCVDRLEQEQDAA